MIFHSPSPDVDIPNIAWSEYFLKRIEPYHVKPALIDGVSGKVTTFDELKEAIQAVAGSLQCKGYEKGDMFAIYAPNSSEFVIVFQAILLLGGVITTVNPLYMAHELAHQLNHANAVCLFTIPTLLEQVKPVLETSSVREMFVFDDPDDVNSLEQLLLGRNHAEFTAVKIDPDKDLAVLPYSSGTTGLPKGVMLSHRNLVAHNVQIEAQVDASHPGIDDRIIAVLPFFHIFGMTVNMNLGLTNGSTLIIMPGFDPEQFLRVIQHYRVSHAFLVPPIILFLANHPLVNDYDINSLKYILSGAAPLGEEQVLAVSQRIGCPVYQGYGLTETSPVTHRSPDLSATIKNGSVGVLLPNTEAMIVDVETGKPLVINQTGEILMRGPQVMMGYLNNQQATTATIDEFGWLHTGDIASADDEGYFYIVDRLKELIKYKAYQVAPAELEALLLTHPAVADVAVIPYPDKEAGEVPKAFIVKQEKITAEAIMDWVAKQVAPYKKVRIIEFIDQIPKSPSGKILRRVLRDL